MIEKSNKDLCVQNRFLEAEVRELTAGLQEEQWMVQDLVSHLEQVEVRQTLLVEILEVVNPAPIVVDLTQEDEGGVGGLIILAPKTPVALFDLDVRRLETQQELITKLDHLLANLSQSEETTSGEYTLTRLSAWGLEF